MRLAVCVEGPIRCLGDAPGVAWGGVASADRESTT